MENVDCSCQLQKNRLDGFSRPKILFPNLHWNSFFEIHATRTKPQEWDLHCNALPSNYQPPTSKCKHEYRSGKKPSVQVFHQKTLVVVGSWGAGIIDTLWNKYIYQHPFGLPCHIIQVDQKFLGVAIFNLFISLAHTKGHNQAKGITGIHNCFRQARVIKCAQ